MRFNLLLLLFCSIYSAISLADDLKPYPDAMDGYQRFVIHLEKLDHEENYQIELLIGKKLLVDCNQQFFSGQLEEKTISGWGYSYYIVPKIVGPVSTMMACPSNLEKQSAFVMMRNNTGTLKRYNSKLPLVVYVPAGFEVRYRLWSADTATHDAVAK